jgi:hypothetical protein
MHFACRVGVGLCIQMLPKLRHHVTVAIPVYATLVAAGT